MAKTYSVWALHYSSMRDTPLADNLSKDDASSLAKQMSINNTLDQIAVASDSITELGTALETYANGKLVARDTVNGINLSRRRGG